MVERSRPAPLLDSFRFGASYACAETGGLAPMPFAAQLAEAPLPPTSRTHPERRDLLLTAAGPSLLLVSSARAARRPANWVRKLTAMHAALDASLKSAGALLLPGASPFHPSPALPDGTPAPIKQGLRLELPFGKPGDFGKLMAAVRVALPLIPAISASTPFSGGKAAGVRSSRLRAWLDEADRHPARVSGFIPEPLFDLADHDREVLGPIAQALGPSGRDGAIDPTLLDWRAASVSHDPDAIVINAIDMQENPAADMAVLEFVIAVLRALTSGRWVSSYLQRAWSTGDLMAVMSATIAQGGQAVITNRDYLLMFGLMKQEELPAAKLLQHIFVELYGDLSANARDHVALIIEHGELAGRLLARAGKRPSPERVREIHAALAACRSGAAFR